MQKLCFFLPLFMYCHAYTAVPSGKGVSLNSSTINCKTKCTLCMILVHVYMFMCL